jgi:hypothetical protein
MCEIKWGQRQAKRECPTPERLAPNPELQKTFFVGSHPEVMICVFNIESNQKIPFPEQMTEIT